MPIKDKKGRRGRRQDVRPLLLVALGLCLLGIGWRLTGEAQAAQRLNSIRNGPIETGAPEIVVIELAAKARPGNAQEDERREPVKQEDSSPAWGEESPHAADSQTVTRCKALAGENEEFFGWLTVPGTKVDYPVMFSPGRAQYYLRRDFSGARTKGGTPFMDENCNPEVSRANLIFYGHNMKNGTMFGQLKRYLDESFYKAHNRFTFATPQGENTYEIVSVYLTKLDVDAAFKFYHYACITEAEPYLTYCRNIRERSLYQTDWEPAFGDELITLVTCSNHVKEGRLLVIGKKITS